MLGNERPDGAVSAERAAAIEGILKSGDLTPEDADRIMRLLKEMKERVQLTAEPASQTNVPELAETESLITPKQAREIMGRGNFYGPEAVQNAFGIVLNPDQIPRIPFSRAELRQAVEELDQMLILRVDKDPDGADLTMKAMIQRRNSRANLLHDTAWYTNEPFFTHDTPRPGWVLQARDILPDSSNKGEPEQTEALAKYVQQVFADQEMPLIFREAIDEFESQKADIRLLMVSSWQLAGEKLSQLKLNQLVRRLPAELLYDFILLLKNQGQRLLSNDYERSLRRASLGAPVAVGGSASHGLHVFGIPPNKCLDGLGVSFSRRQ